jgi:uncharacterized protein YukE
MTGRDSMTAQAIADPEDLERFARDLNAFTDGLKDSIHRLNGSFGRLSETWRDQENQKFAYEYQQTIRVLEQFFRTAEEHIPFLVRKAERIRDYLAQG